MRQSRVVCINLVLPVLRPDTTAQRHRRASARFLDLLPEKPIAMKAKQWQQKARLSYHVWVALGLQPDFIITQLHLPDQTQSDVC